MLSKIDLLATTHIEAGHPIAMHRQIGNAIVGKQFRLDIREYRWDEAVVSSGSTRYIHLLSAYSDGRSHSACSFESGSLLSKVPIGDILLIPPNRKIIFQSPPGYQRFLSLIVDPPMVPLIASIEWNADTIEKAMNIRHPEIQSLMSKMALELNRPTLGSTTMVEGILLQLEVELCRFFSPIYEESTQTQHLSQHQLENIVTLVDRRQFAPSLAELADCCHLSRRHLTRSFKLTTGMTIGEFIFARQIARAKDLLYQENVLIKQVAYQSGFKSTAAFSAAFKRATGMTPTSFRHQVASSKKI
jgi:AraC family transcriptional regulator